MSQYTKYFRMIQIYTKGPHCVGEIWKRSFISKVVSTVHSNPPRKRSFSITLFKPEGFENAGFAF